MLLHGDIGFRQAPLPLEDTCRSNSCLQIEHISSVRLIIDTTLPCVITIGLDVCHVRVPFLPLLVFVVRDEVVPFDGIVFSSFEIICWDLYVDVVGVIAAGCQMGQ